MNQELSLIKSKCQAAITAHTGGDPVEAFNLMDEMGRRYENCGLVYGAQYRLHALEASRIKTSDSALFQKHVRSAVESARHALSLSPNSAEFWTLYAQALLKLSSSDGKGLDDALRECERALSIENPLEHCRDASLSLKAMLWEERCESESSRMSERKKQAVLEEIAMVKMGKLRMYWNAMSEETKMGLFGPRIGDLREYYSSLCEDGPAERVFSEGIGYVEKNKNWKFWPCYYCDEKFEHYEMRMKHIERKHFGVIGQNLQIKPYLFPEIDADGGSEVYHNLQIVNGTIYIIKELIVLTGDSSCPLDDRLLRVEVMPHRHHDGVENDENGSASPCSICDSVVLPVPPDIDAFGQWLFAGPPTSTAEELASWTHLQHQMKHEGTEAPKRFKDEFNRLQAFRSRQSELMVQCRCLQAIQIICAQELGKRENGREHVHQSYKSLLKEGSMSTEKISMLNTITRVLTQAENNRHYPSESNEFEDQEDASIRMTIHQKLKPLLSELCRNEARIRRSSAVMWRLSVIYKQANLDYRGIMLPLMRNSIHAKLEALIYEGEEEKQETMAVPYTKSSRSPRKPQLKFLIYGRTGWIGDLLGKICEKQGIAYEYGSGRLEDRSLLLADIQSVKPTHVFNDTGVTGRPNVDWCETHKTETIWTNVVGTLTLADISREHGLLVMNFATGCIFEYDANHPEGSGIGFKEEDTPNFTGSFYSKTMAMVEEFLKEYNNVCTLRVRMPVSSDLNDPHNSITEISRYNKMVNIPNSMTILDELLPISVEMAKRNLRGIWNFTNPGVVSPYEILEMYKKYIDPDFKWANITLEEQAEVIVALRSNNELDASKLKKEFPKLLPIKESLIKYVFEPNKKTVAE